VTEVRREDGRFVFTDGAAEAELLFERDGDRLVLVHTGVPDELGGRGVGGALVRAAVEWAGKTGLTVVPWCPFTRRWLRDHPDVAREATIDWSSRPS